MFNKNDMNGFKFWKNCSKNTDFIEEAKSNLNLKKLIRYDENFNNKRKVLFESCLAGSFLQQPDVIYPSVVKVAKSILPEFIGAFNQVIKTIDNTDKELLICHHFYDFMSHKDQVLAEYTGKCDAKIDNSLTEMKHFINWIYATLDSEHPKNIRAQLSLIYAYGSFFVHTNLHLPHFKGLKNQSVEDIPEGLGDSNLKTEMKKLRNISRIGWPKNILEQGRKSTKNTPRAKTTNMFGIFATDKEEVKMGYEEFIPKSPKIFPGKGVWRVTSSSNFTKKARYELDMPLIASQGGSIAFMLIPAIAVAKLTREELRFFNLAALSYLIGNGHHSLHEFSVVWKNFNIPYTDGNYFSIFPEGLIEKLPLLRKLQTQFPELISNMVPST